jgi:AraC-like DNA-binding protein
VRADRRAWFLRRAFPLTIGALLVLTLLTVGLTYQASSRLLRENLNEANQAALREIVARVDNAFVTVDHLLVAIATDPDVRNYLAMRYDDTPSLLLDASRVQGKMGSIRRTAPLVSSIMIANFRHGELLTDATSFTLESFPDQSIAELVRSTGVDGAVVGPRQTSDPAGHFSGTRDTLFVVRPYPLGVPGTISTGGVIASVPVAALQRQVAQYAAEAGVNVSFRAADETTVAATDLTPDGAPVRWRSDPVVSSRTNLVFEATAPTESSQLGLRRFRVGVVVVALAGVVLACLVALVLDRGLRKPWEETVLAIATDVEAAAHPSEDVAERTVWSLPAIRRDVHDAIERARELEGRYATTRDAMLQQVLTSHLLSPRAGESDPALLSQLGIPGPLYIVVLLDLGRPGAGSSLSGTTPTDDELVRLVERSYERIGPTRGVLLPDGILGAVVCPNGTDGVARRTRGLVIALRGAGYRDVAAAVGHPHEGAGAIHSSYVEATFALEFRVVRPEAPVISYADVSTHAASLLPRPVADQLMALRETMHRRSSDALREWAQEFLVRVDEHCRVPVALKHALARFVTDASELAHRLRLETAETPPDFHHALWAGRNRGEVNETFARAVEWYADALERSRSTGVAERRGRELIQKVDEMLFDPSLSLTLVADSVGASAAHVSRLFKQASGRTFQQYVAQSRAHEAERLLCSTHEPVKTIAERVGYPEVHTLIRVFKRQYGATPAEYRRRASVS